MSDLKVYHRFCSEISFIEYTLLSKYVLRTVNMPNCDLRPWMTGGIERMMTQMGTFILQRTDIDL